MINEKRFRLSEKEMVRTNQFSLIVFSEGSGNQNILFTGIKKTVDQFITFKGTYHGIIFTHFSDYYYHYFVFKGDYYSSVNELDRLTSNFHHFSFVEAKCRCRFDILHDSFLLQKDGHFVPAMFIIEADWVSENKENKGNSSQLEALTMPPDKATALIVHLNI